MVDAMDACPERALTTQSTALSYSQITATYGACVIFKRIMRALLTRSDGRKSLNGRIKRGMRFCQGGQHYPTLLKCCHFAAACQTASLCESDRLNCALCGALYAPNAEPCLFHPLSHLCLVSQHRSLEYPDRFWDALRCRGTDGTFNALRAGRLNGEPNRRDSAGVPYKWWEIVGEPVRR